MDTMLHMDAADAVKFSVYMEGLGEESEWWLGDEAEGYALWLLWGCKDVEPLWQYLREHFQLGLNIDPINLGDLHITRDMFEVLKARGIQPYVVHQQVGQAVIIPALTPHYVHLYTNWSFQTNFIVP